MRAGSAILYLAAARAAHLARDDELKLTAMHSRVFCIVLMWIVLSSAFAGCTSTVFTPSLHVPILMYHYISANPRAPADPLRTRLSVPPAQFAQQLAYLHRAGYTTITLDDLVDALHLHATLPSKPVILTFDDGYQDFYTNAYPLLRRYRDKATIYIITRNVGTPG